MDDDHKDLQSGLRSLLDGGAVDGAFAQELRGRYPFFTLPDALLLRRSAEAGLPHPEGEEQRRLLARLALNSCDASAATRLAAGEEGCVESFYPPAPRRETPTTESAIDTFLSSYGTRSDEEDALLERLIFNPVPDYALTLEAAEDDGKEEAVPLPPPVPVESAVPPVPGPDAGQDAAADGGSPEPPRVTGEAPAASAAAPAKKTRGTVGSQDLLSESLAKIFIKTRRYDKAYEILERLSLDFPEKSRYFADQLRFLRKLILIEEHRRKQQGQQPE